MHEAAVPAHPLAAREFVGLRQCSAKRPISVRFVRKSGRHAAASSSVVSARHAACHALPTLATMQKADGPNLALCKMTAKSVQLTLATFCLLKADTTLKVQRD